MVRTNSRSRSRSRTPKERIDKFGRVIPADRPKSRSRSPSRSRIGSKRRSTSRRRSSSRHRSTSRRRSRSRSPPRRFRRSRSRSPIHSRYPRREERREEAPRIVDHRVQNRTNIEDPEFLNARLFIGNLPSAKVTKEELEALFNIYGKILGVSIHDRGFGFVQFEKEEDARKAQEAENGTKLKGNVLDVKMAAEGRRGGHGGGRGGRGGGPGGGRDFDREHTPGGRGGPPPGGHMRDRSPVRGDPYEDRYRDPFRREPPPPVAREDFDKHGTTPARDDPYYRDDPYRRPAPAHDEPYRDPYREDPYRRDAAPAPYRRDPFDDPFRDPYYREPFYPPPPPKKPVPADVQIICLNKQLTQYAESIESRLRVHALIVDIVIIPEDLTVPQMVEEAARLKFLFAITLNSQNEAHKSLTLNILHGTPQEHRNMPMEDSIKLVATSFEKYIQAQKEKAAGPVVPPAAVAPGVVPPVAAATTAAAAPPFVPPPTDISYLLNLLADNRQLTMEELDKVLEYLKERKTKMLKAKGLLPESSNSRAATGASVGGGDSMTTLQQQQQEIQSKILNILNGSGSSTSGSLSAAPQAMQAAQAVQAAQGYGGQSARAAAGQGGGASNPLINFDNPSVQKALDNLIQSGPSLLKSLPSSMAQQQAPPRNQFAGQGQGQQGASRYPPSQPPSQPPVAQQQVAAAQMNYGQQYYQPPPQQQNVGVGAPGQGGPRGGMGGGAYGGQQQGSRPLMSVRAPQQGARPRY